MAKAFITGGSVTVEQSKKLAEYENRKASVTFNVGEGEDASTVVIDAGALAFSTVQSLLGNERKTFEQRVLDGAIERANPAVAAGAPLPKEKKPTVKKPPAQPATNTADPLADPTGAPPAAEVKQISTGEPRVDPTELAEDPFSASVPTITDAQVSEAVTRKNAALIAANKTTGGDGTAGTRKIKDLIAKFGVTRVQELPQPKRADFLKELEALA